MSTTGFIGVGELALYTIKGVRDAGYQVVLDNGGEVRILKFFDGCSTTAVINAIKKKV